MRVKGIFSKLYRPTSLRFRLTALVLVVAVLVLLITTYFINERAVTVIEQNSPERLNAANRTLTTAVSVWLESHLNALRNFVSLPDIISMDAKRQKPLLQKMADAYPYMYLVSTTDLRGKNVARNDDEQPKDYSDREWFQKARKGEPLVFQSLIGKTIGAPALVLSMPIKNKDNRIVGVGMFATDLVHLARQVRATRVGMTGFAYIVDQQNRVIAHPDPAYASELRDLKSYPPVASLRHGMQGQVIFSDSAGQKWRADVAELANGWGVVVQQHEEEMLSTRRVFQKVALAIIVMAVLVLMGATWWVVRLSLQPIEAFTKVVTTASSENLGSPDLEYLHRAALTIRTGDEIGTLAKSFGKLAERLQETLKSLEQELTEQKRTEASLRDSEEKYRSLVQNVNIGVYRNTGGPHGRFVQANPAMLKIFGYDSLEEFLDTPVSALYQKPEDRIRYVAEISQKGFLKDKELALRKKDGTPIWCSVSAAAQFDKNGNIQFMDGVIEDITERKRVEESLVESRNYLDKIINSVANPIFVKDRQHHWILLNEAFCTFMGRRRDELLGRSDYDFFPKEEADVFWSKDEVVFMSGEENLNEEKFTDAKKIAHTIITKKALYRDEKGEQYIVGIITDMTERKKLEDQLRQSQKMETVGLLAGGVAHDFNNLLTPILGYADLLILGLPEGDPRRAQLQEVKNAAVRAKDLTRRLLTFSRKQMLELKTVDLGGIIRQFENVLRRTIREDITIETRIAPSLSMVRADAGQIEQVLVNLSINAQDAMPEGGSLTIEAKDIDLDESYTAKHPDITPGGYVMLSVRDTGVGMDEETLQHLFEPFFTTKELGRGTGLGLSTVYGIVKQHGGGIAVYSEKDAGSIFKVFLPRAREAGAMVAQPPSPADEIAHGAETVLVVEDNEAVQKLISDMLKGLGYQVLCAENPDRCIELVNEYRGPIKLLLTDVVMPRMNGMELFSTLHRVRPDLKVLFMSGYASNVIGHHGVLDEGVNFLQKPFSVHALSRKVRQVLDSVNYRSPAG